MDAWQLLFLLWGFFVTPVAVFVLHSWGLEQQRKLKVFEEAFQVAETERKRLAEKVSQLELHLMRTNPPVLRGRIALGSVFRSSDSQGR